MTPADVSQLGLILITAALAIANILLVLRTGKVAGETRDLAGATKQLALSATKELEQLEKQTEAMTRQAKIAADQLLEIRTEREAAARPLLRWELRNDWGSFRSLAQDSNLMYLDIQCRLHNYGAAVYLRPVIDTPESSGPVLLDPLNEPPTLLPPDGRYDVDLALGPSNFLSYPSHHVKFKIDVRPVGHEENWRAAIGDAHLTFVADEGYRVVLRSELS